MGDTRELVPLLMGNAAAGPEHGKRGTCLRCTRLLYCRAARSARSTANRTPTVQLLPSDLLLSSPPMPQTGGTAPSTAPPAPRTHATLLQPLLHSPLLSRSSPPDGGHWAGVWQVRHHLLHTRLLNLLLFLPPVLQTAAIGQEYGKYGIIRETDMYSKRPEFQLWAIEVRFHGFSFLVR